MLTITATTTGSRARGVPRALSIHSAIEKLTTIDASMIVTNLGSPQA